MKSKARLYLSFVALCLFGTLCQGVSQDYPLVPSSKRDLTLLYGVGYEPTDQAVCPQAPEQALGFPIRSNASLEPSTRNAFTALAEAILGQRWGEVRELIWRWWEQLFNLLFPPVRLAPENRREMSRADEMPR